MNKKERDREWESWNYRETLRGNRDGKIWEKKIGEMGRGKYNFWCKEKRRKSYCLYEKDKEKKKE